MKTTTRKREKDANGSGFATTIEDGVTLNGSVGVIYWMFVLMVSLRVLSRENASARQIGNEKIQIISPSWKS